ncbi:MAG: hypothetical protein U0Q15_15120 [Kineosporiaceae bacterium]
MSEIGTDRAAVDAFATAVGRLEARLRVLGPRWAAARRRDPEASAAEVSHVRALLAELEGAAASARGEAAHPVPELGEHALADVLAVLAHELLEVTSEAAVAGLPALTDRVDEVRRAL